MGGIDCSLTAASQKADADLPKEVWVVDGFGAIVELRGLPVPAHLIAGDYYPCEVHIYRDAKILMSGPAMIHVSPQRWDIINQVIPETIFLAINTDVDLSNLIKAEVMIENIGSRLRENEILSIQEIIDRNTG